MSKLGVPTLTGNDDVDGPASVYPVDGSGNYVDAWRKFFDGDVQERVGLVDEVRHWLIPRNDANSVADEVSS